MKKLILANVLIIIALSCKEANEQDYLTQQDKAISVEKEEEWLPLIQENNLDDWDIKITGHEVGKNYNDTFRVEDNMIRVSYDEYESFNNSFGHLYYKKPYAYYKLKMDYRFVGQQVKGGESWANRNSGVMFHSQSAQSNSLGQFFPVSIELQFLGGLGDGEERPTGNVCTPGTAIKMADTLNFQHCINSNSKTYDGEQWVHAELVVLGGEKIIHIINNDTVMVYQSPIIGGGLLNKGADEEWKSTGIDNQDEWLVKDGQPLKEGYFALQAESTPIDFKNIEVLDLCGCMDQKAKNYKSYYVKADNSKCEYE